LVAVCIIWPGFQTIQLSGIRSEDMTRITNFGRKRTYVEAGFNTDPVAESSVNEPSAVENVEVTPKEDSMTVDAPPKKKRKRSKKPKPQADEDGGANGVIERRDDQTKDEEDLLETNTVETKSKKSNNRPNQKKDKKSKGALLAVPPPIIFKL
jgi:zinc finger CCHC domain-containing protein 9